jgi:hypothetical protein
LTNNNNTMPKTQEEMKGEGFDRPTIKEIESAARHYTNKRGEFQKASEACTKAKERLRDTMKEHADSLESNGDGERLYRLEDGETVILTEKFNVKVKPAEDPDQE